MLEIISFIKLIKVRKKILKSQKKSIGFIYSSLFLSLFLYPPKVFSQSISESSLAAEAKLINVKIFGPASSGSGVILNKVNSIYEVLTANHVIEGVKQGDEVEIMTPDGKYHLFIPSSINKVPNVDMATIKFSSLSNYKTAKLGDSQSIRSGNRVYVAGFPLPTASVDKSIFRFQGGNVIANSSSKLKDGYNLLYSNPSLPGMSGGSVINEYGELIAIHGRSELDTKASSDMGKLISTGVNQAIPVSYFKAFKQKKDLVISESKKTSDDYLAEAYSSFQNDEKPLKILKLAKQSLDMNKTALGYTLMGIAKNDLSDSEGAMEAYDEALKIDENIELALRYRAENFRGSKALNLYNKLIKLYPGNMYYYFKRSEARAALGDNEGKLEDRLKTLELAKQQNLWSRPFASSDDPNNVIKLAIYSMIGNNYYELGDIPKACEYWNKSYESGGATFYSALASVEYIAHFLRGRPGRSDGRPGRTDDPRDKYLEDLLGRQGLEDVIYKVCL